VTEDTSVSLQAALKNDPSDVESALCLARLERALGRSDSAARLLEGFAPSYPKRPDVACECALAQLDRREIARADDAIHAAGKNRLAAAHGKFWLAVGRAAELRNDPKHATEAYRLALSLPNLSLALRAELEHRLADSLAGVGEKPKSATARERAAAAKRLLDSAQTLAGGNLDAAVRTASDMVERALAIDAVVEAAALDYFLGLQKESQAKWKSALNAAQKESLARMQQLATGRDAAMEAAVARLTKSKPRKSP
jgi:hypothetical protein